ncbi:MAG: hypothetical protein JRH19_01725, partial [Deltaproteobacteria bacterium]|nr:hypothetical protein [Deltaproteobacteria bacterium]
MCIPRSAYARGVMLVITAFFVMGLALETFGDPSDSWRFFGANLENTHSA